MAQHEAVSRVTQTLSMYIATALHQPVPDAVCERAKLHIVDTYAAMISGAALPAGLRAIEHVKSLNASGKCGLLGTRLVTSPLYAALANGMFGHADESDDTHPLSLTHPGTSIVPAAVAIGESRGLNGLHVLRAIVLGYDVCARLLLSLGPVPFLRSGHHAGAFGQLFGAAAAAGALLDLDAREVRYLLSYTAQQAAGLYTMFRDPGHIERAYAMGGMPAHNGVHAALMAASGFTGVEDVFSGERDFFHTFAPGTPDREALVAGLGRRFEVMRGGVKRWPVGAPIQAPLHALREMMTQHAFDTDQVTGLIVRLPERELEFVNERPQPDVCIQHLLAVMLTDRELTFASAHDTARMQDPRVLALRSRIATVGEPTPSDPEGRWRCAITIELADGRRVEHEVGCAPGSGGTALPRAEEDAKARDLLVPVLGKPRTVELLAQLWNFEKLVDVRGLRTLYQP